MTNKQYALPNSKDYFLFNIMGNIQWHIKHRQYTAVSGATYTVTKSDQTDEIILKLRVNMRRYT